MKCRMAVFEDAPVYDPNEPFIMCIPVECGGDIEAVGGDIIADILSPPRGYYCTRCGVRYEKLPTLEDEGCNSNI